MGLPEIQMAKKILELKESVNNSINKLEEDIENLNNLIKDVYHIYGLGNIDAIDMMLLASEFRTECKERFKKIDELKVLKSFAGVFEKHKDFFDELQYVINKIEAEIIHFERRGYRAKSEKGQELINKFSKKNDDLIISLKDFNKVG